MQLPLAGGGNLAEQLPDMTQAKLFKKPQQLLYSINARLGGYGLDLNCFEAVRLAHREGYLGKVVVYANQQHDIPCSKVKSLRYHPIRLLSFLDSPFYYDAKKRYLDWIASRLLATNQYDLFHAWSGNALQSLRVTKCLGIPSLLEIPTWHRDKGKVKPREKVEVSKHERNARFPETLFTSLLISRQDTLEEYDLADLLLLQSTYAAKTFRIAGMPEEKMYILGGGVDTQQFQSIDHAQIPAAFSASRPMRAMFVGALIKRKGVHILLQAWKELNLPHAKLKLVGKVHKEIEPYLEAYLGPSIEVQGFTRNVSQTMREADLHIFPSECEGSAKTVYEACATGLAQISTLESGDSVQDGVNGLIVPCNDVSALKDAIRYCYEHPDRMRDMGRQSREKALREFDWEHFRSRLAGAYDLAIRRSIAQKEKISRTRTH